MVEHHLEVLLEDNPDPIELVKFRTQMERFERNCDWLQAHAAQVYSHRGKFICVAGQELFVGDSVADVLARAAAAHPDDDGRFTQYIPKERELAEKLRPCSSSRRFD